MSYLRQKGEREDMVAQESHKIECPKCGAECSVLWWKDRSLRYSREAKDPVSILKCPEHGYITHSIMTDEDAVIRDFRREIQSRERNNDE